MIPSTVREEILRRIAAAQNEHGVRVLFAVESGSRAWGFASPDSDFDARFVYAHPRERYLTIDFEDHRDVIEYPIVDDIDLNGWDIRKALRLFSKSNPTFVEWIQSPIVYVERGLFAKRARELLATVYSRQSGVYHYHRMAKSNYRGYLRADLVPLKKYFYVLRPLLAIRWIERESSAPPIEFARLLEQVDDVALRGAVDDLLERKRRAPETGLAPPVPIVQAFIEEELERLAPSLANRPTTKRNTESLNALFIEVLE